MFTFLYNNFIPISDMSHPVYTVSDKTALSIFLTDVNNGKTELSD